MGASSTRLSILEGLLDFRAEIHEAGVNGGFQWLNGSFSENVESIEGRAPRDVDAVTFVNLPEGQEQGAFIAENTHLFDRAYIRDAFHVDAYWQFLGGPLNAQSIQSISYWYSMWSHRRDGMWKGFVQVELDPTQDHAAMQGLARAKADLGVE